jgi:hypothetical protein
LDADGNVYTCGNVNGVVDFDPGPGEALSPPGSGVNGDLFVVKYDNSGNYLWYYQVGGSGYEVARNVVVDGNGDVLLVGTYNSFFDWDPGPGVVQPGVGAAPTWVGKAASGAGMALSRLGHFPWLGGRLNFAGV